MNVIETSLKRPVTVLILTISLVYFGLMAYQQMGMQRIPDVDLPVVTVTTTMTGATAQVMDNDVTDVIEEQLNTISDVNNISSASYQGVAVTAVEFNLGRNIDAAAADVRDKVNAAQADLPDDADAPIIAKYDIGDTPLVMAVVTGPASYKDKVYFTDKVMKVKLQSVSGVGNIDTPGLRDRQVRVWIDPVRLRSRGLVVSDLSNAIKSKHVELPAGSLTIDRFKMDLRLEGEYSSVEDLKQLPITARDGVVIRLADVADIEDSFEEESNLAYYNDQSVIVIEVRKQRGANEVQVCDAAKAKIEEIKGFLPKGINVDVVYDSAAFIRRSMNGVGSDVIQAIVLCSLLMLFFLQTMRATFVTIITMPVCLIGALTMMKGLGVTINNLSMMGISLAVGMVVDATTVVLENVDRHMKDGMSAYEASSVGAKEVAFSVIGGALTTIAVFAPISFMGGIIGRLFFAFGITVVLTIGLSLVESVTLTPFLCSRILNKAEPGRIARFCDGILTSWERVYRKALTMAVHHRWITIAVATGLCISGIFLARKIGTSFMADDDRGYFQISCELASGTDLDETGRVLQNVAAEVRKNKSVDFTLNSVGSGRGNESNKGTIYVYLRPRKERKEQKYVMADVRESVQNFRDVTMNFSTYSGKDVSMMLLGATSDKLLAVSNKMIADMKASGKMRDIETDVRLDKPQLNVQINRSMTDAMNVDIKSLSTEVQAYFGGTKVGVYKESGYRYDIRLMSRKGQRTSLSDIQQVSVKNGSGDIVQAPGLINVDRILAPNVVKRYNRQNALAITANVTSDFSTGQAVTMMQELAAKYIPAESGMTLVSSGQTKNTQDDFARLLTALIIAISLVYVVMAIQFESFLHPLTIMFSLPLMTPGAFGALYLAGCKLDMMSYMGIILLVGIVVNNGIILVDFINQQREQGVEKVQAVINAGPLRLRAILITSLSTLIGAIPAALKLSEGSESRQPMSVATFGGLLTSTFLTLLVIPVVYLIFDDLKDFLGRWWRRFFGKKEKTVKDVPAKSAEGGVSA